MLYKDILKKQESRLWLCGMFAENQKKDLEECFGPIYDYFDGIVATFHWPAAETAEYLESIKKQGEILYTKWCYRNELSRNIYLWQGPIVNGDWFIGLDNNELLKPEFFSDEYLGFLLDICDKNEIDGVVLYGKRFMFRYNDFMRHAGDPHEGLQGAHRVIELTQIEKFKDSEKYFVNLRPIRRDKFVFINAFLKYYLSYPVSNHCLLGCENDMREFERRETLRRKFRVYCQKVLRIELTWQGYLEYIKNNVLTDLDKEFINNEVILNDFYKYHILDDRDLSHYKEKNQIITI